MMRDVASKKLCLLLSRFSISLKFFKAQVAAEQMFAVAIVLLPLVFIVAYAYTTVQEYLNVFLIQTALDSLQSAINNVYASEPNTYSKVSITLPGGINFSDSYIGSPSGSPGVHLQLSYKGSNAFRIVRANVTGSWLPVPGTTLYKVYKSRDNIIRVSSGSDLSYGLVGFWKLDNNTEDLSKNGKGATAYNGVNCSRDVIGPVGRACTFDGVDDYLSIDDSDEFDFGSQDFSVVFWVKKEQHSTAWSNTWGVNKWHTGNSPGSNEWSVGLTKSGNDDKVSFGIEEGTTAYFVNSSESLPLGSWHHIVAVKNSTHIMLYIDGALNATLYVGRRSVNNVGRDIRVANSALDAHYTRGAFDEIRLYNRALSAYEVQELYDQGDLAR